MLPSSYFVYEEDTVNAVCATRESCRTFICHPDVLPTDRGLDIFVAGQHYIAISVCVSIIRRFYTGDPC